MLTINFPDQGQGAVEKTEARRGIQWVAILMWTLFIFIFFSNYLKTTQRIIVEI